MEVRSFVSERVLIESLVFEFRDIFDDEVEVSVEEESSDALESCCVSEGKFARPGF